MAHVNRRIGKSSEEANVTADGTGGGVLDAFLSDYFNRSGNVYNAPGVSPLGIQASGGVVSDYTDPGGTIYRAHVFTSSGNFVVNQLAIGDFPDSLEYLVVAGGGGGGGGAYGGGGGAGGVRTNLSGHPLATGNPSFTATVTSYTVTVGGGGGGGVFNDPSNPNSGTDANQGVDSYFGPPSAPQGITAKGGGRGMGRGTSVGGATAGYPGGSGGGGAYRTPVVGYGYNPSTPSPIVPNIPSPHPYGITQGNNGGFCDGTAEYGSAGGGAGGVGADGGGPLNHGGDGGAGVQVLIAGPPTTIGVGATGPAGAVQYFAGGGAGGGGGTNHADRFGGGASPSGANTGTGPFAGAGNGADNQDGRAATSALSGTGSGGGGGSEGASLPANEAHGGSGGSGVVIVRYQIGTVQSAKATGGAISHYLGKTIHTFTSSGTFTNTSGSNLTVDHVIIAGGGAGGATYHGAGGGAGGVRTSIPGIMPATADSQVVVSPGSPNAVTVQVGAGGKGVYGNDGGTGTPSYFGPLIANGGGGGGGHNTSNDRVGSSGGSGGGSGQGPGPAVAGAVSNPDSNPTRQGNPGGDAGSHPGGGWSGAGGGGGAGGAGSDGDNGTGSPNADTAGGGGGIGIQLPSTFQNPYTLLGAPGPNSEGFWFAGGGGGSGGAATTPATAYGRGGTGTPGDSSPGPFAGGGNASYELGSNGSANTGGGGGGSERMPAPPNKFYPGGYGGSGIVIITYPT